MKPTEDSIDSFVEKLLEIKKHSFNAEQQAAFFQEVKENLEPGTIIVGGNFSENYHFVVQDAAQGYHWANDQVTIHPFIVYHKLVIIVSMTIYLYLKMPSFFNFSLNL